MLKPYIQLYNIRNGVEDLKYTSRCSAHKSKYNRWQEADITLYRQFAFFRSGHLKTSKMASGTQDIEC